jgi:hypothetical protein
MGDARSYPTMKYRLVGGGTVEYRLVGGGTAECRQPAGRLARGGAGGDRATRGEGEGDLRRESGVRVFSRRQSRPVPTFLSSGVPERTRGAGMAWALRIDEGPNARENEEPGARLGRITPSG